MNSKGSIPIQTFLPYADFELSAKSLDPKRLHNQRNEAKTILYIVTEKYKGTTWDFHPAVKMWRGYARSLLAYIKAIDDECNHRRIKGSIWDKLCGEFPDLLKSPIINPPWLGTEALHASHRSNLIRKDTLWYLTLGWTDPNNLSYYWPTQEG